MKEKVYEYQKMFSVEKELWWYKILHLLIVRTLNKFFDRKDVSILDAGCGTGGLMTRLIENGYDNIQGFDFSSHAVEFSKKNNLDVVELNLLDFSENKLDKKFDVIISNDTLNYFSEATEQKKVLDNFYNNLNDNGIVIMNVAVFDEFKGIHDMAVGSQLRFSVDGLSDLLEQQNFKINNLRIWPFLLSPLIYMIRKNQRRKIKQGQYSVSSDSDVPSSIINKVLYAITRLELSLSAKFPFGSSAMVILQKK